MSGGLMDRACAQCTRSPRISNNPAENQQPPQPANRVPARPRLTMYMAATAGTQYMQ